MFTRLTNLSFPPPGRPTFSPLPLKEIYVRMVNEARLDINKMFNQENK